MVISFLGAYVRPQNPVIIIALCTIIISGAKRRKIFLRFKSCGRHFFLIFWPLGGAIAPSAPPVDPPLISSCNTGIAIGSYSVDRLGVLKAVALASRILKDS